MIATKTHFGLASRAFVTVAALACLAGCTNLTGLGGTSEVKCRAKESGIPCMSVSGIAENERAGTLRDLDRRVNTEAAPASDVSENGQSDRSSSTQTPARLQNISLATGTADRPVFGAIRSEPTVIRVWIAPWEDSDGDLNDQTYVYLQIDSGRWQVERNLEAIRREFTPTSRLAAGGEKREPASVPSAAPQPARSGDVGTSSSIPPRSPQPVPIPNGPVSMGFKQ